MSFNNYFPVVIHNACTMHAYKYSLIEIIGTMQRQIQNVYALKTSTLLCQMNIMNIQ